MNLLNLFLKGQEKKYIKNEYKEYKLKWKKYINYVKFWYFEKIIISLATKNK
jgi:hypothetical protein